MTRQTEKFLKAVAIAGNRFRNSAHEVLYQMMTESNHYWDSRSKEWIYTPSDRNDPPTQLHRVRVWAAREEVEALASAIIEGLIAQGYSLADRSTLYPCRPPKGSEARIYLSFNPPIEPLAVTVEAVAQPERTPRPGDMVMGGRASGR